MRIRVLLALTTIAPVLPRMIAAAIAFDKVKDGQRDAVLRGRETVRASTLLVDREIPASMAAMNALGNSELLAQVGFKALYAQAAAINRMPGWTLWLDEDGTRIFNTDVPFGTPPPMRARARGAGAGDAGAADLLAVAVP